MSIHLVHIDDKTGVVTSRAISPMPVWGETDIAFLEGLVNLLIAIGVITEPHALPTRELDWALQPVQKG